MGNVLVDNLKPGMTLNADVIDGSGRLLFSSGTVINKDFIRMLKTRDIAHVDIQGVEEEKPEPEEPVQPEDPPIVSKPPKVSVSDSAPKSAPVEKEISQEDENKLRIMRATPFFSPFTDDELSIILRTCTWLRCGSGEFVLREGESSDPSFFVILKGSICIQKRLGGTSMKKTIDRLKRGECFGEMAILRSEQRSADVIAEEETYVLKIDADTLNKETDSFDLKCIQFKFYKAFAEILAERLAYTAAMACKLS